MGTLGWVPGFRGSKTSDVGKEFSTGGASHLIRSAEKLAASGRYDFAIEQLSVAQRLDPDNKYIQAIIDRIRMVQNSNQEEFSTRENSSDSSGPLSVTVGPKFATGIRSQEDDRVLAPEDVHARVRFLTNMAEQYLENGSSEKAFDTLMNAYLLDPLSPYVIASEKTVLPAWESARTRTPGPKPDMHAFTSTMEPMMTPSNQNSLTTAINNQTLQPGSTDEQLRMEALKQQKEHERIEKERSVWRDASKPPKIFGEDESSTNPATAQSAAETPKAQHSGLFSKLRLGKFLE